VASVFLAAAVTCFAALFIGQAVLRLLGAKEWNWLAPAVGLSVMMLVSTPTFSIPGRTTTVAIVLALVAVAAAAWCLSSAAHRPPPLGLLALAPVVFLAMVPFLAVGHGGVLGVTVDSDMSVHLIFVESYISSAFDKVGGIPPDYPMGPHSMAALLANGLGIKSGSAFSGFTMALPIVNAMTALAVVRRGSWLGKAIIATVVGLPFLVASFYGQSSFKEVGMAGLTLAVAISLAGYGPKLGRARWVPMALLVGGIISIYSPAGLPWPAAFFGLWAVGLLAVAAQRHQLAAVPAAIRRELPALGIGVGVLILVLLPQAERMYEFVALRNGGSDIEATNLGNLVGPLSGWQAFGVWGNPDYRLPNADPGTVHLWIAFVVVLAVIGTIWAFWRRRWMLPLAAGAALLIYKASVHGGQSPYVSAKALVIASPLVLLLAVLPLAELSTGDLLFWRKGGAGAEKGPANADAGADDRGLGPGRGRGAWRWAWLAVPLLGLVLLYRVGTDDLRGLRYDPVGPTARTEQLESFRSLLAGKKTLYLGYDEFYRWELAGVPVVAVAVGATPLVPQREGKWEYGEAIDFDTVPGSTLNEYEYVVAPRDPDGSEPPANMKPVAGSEAYVVYKRVGMVAGRSILDEGQAPGAVLDCKSAQGRKILAAGGVAAVRPEPIMGEGASIQAGHSAEIGIKLPAGNWQLEAPYLSPYPIKVKGPGLEVERPASLERPGPRLPLGVVTSTGGEQKITLEVGKTWLAPKTATAAFGELVATPVGKKDRVVPIHRACGRYVDWYRSAGSA
jgi:hypothetical protein